MILEKPKLFTQIGQFIIFVVIMLLIVFIRLAWEYRSYRDFIQKPFYYTHAIVVNSYPKERNGRKYTILKLHTEDDKTVYTTSYDRGDLNHKRLYIKLIPGHNIDFWDYIGGMYCKSRIKEISSTADNISSYLSRIISAQHIGKQMQGFYNAIFLAIPVPKELRERIAALGVSHLVALSGFHLGILWSVLYGVLLLFYKPLQQRYFPYRYSLIDVGMIVMIILGSYLWLTDFPPSLVRSYAMMLFGWAMVLMGIELVSFTFLFTIALSLLAIFPSLTISLSFWLSVTGVFYIFLVLQYCQDLNKLMITLICIPLGIFILMQPVVHYFFGLTTAYQLLSPLLSLLFIVFYPLSMLLHLIGQGSLLDGGLGWLFDLPARVNTDEHLMPLWGLVVYVSLSIWAIWSRKVFYLVLSVATGYAIYVLG